MHLPEVEARVASGVHAEVIEELRRSSLPVPQILHLFAYKPEWTEHLARYTQALMRGPSPLPPGFRELIAALTSKLNHCPFWIGSHAAVAAELLGNARLVDSVLEDYRTAPISDAERAMLVLIEKVTRYSPGVSLEDVDEVRAAGWSDEAIYDALSVCALFQFYNTWVDSMGVTDMSEQAYRASGQRLATYGYSP